MLLRLLPPRRVLCSFFILSLKHQGTSVIELQTYSLVAHVSAHRPFSYFDVTMLPCKYRFFRIAVSREAIVHVRQV